MSIFREGFKDEIKTQLTKREDAMLNRTTENLQYINSRNAWVRMCSSVNVNGKPDYAQAYVLQGGTLNDGSSKTNWSFKTGIGDTGKEAYSTKTPLGTDHKLGIRPMPGITSIDVKSKSAYGSLREVTVNFQCWDIHQLEELELLYMRPGYTVLVEWGWAPYLDNSSGYTPSFNNFYSDTLLNNPPTDKSDIFKTLYNLSTKTYNGNYDAMFGYIKNYSWSARPDGGYDCQTIVISTGEIIESLKINYVRPDLQSYGMYDLNGKGFLDDLVTDGGVTTDKYRPAYEKNTLAGIWAELYYKMSANGNAKNSNIKDWWRFPFPGTKYSDDNMIDPGSQNRVYITLDNVFSILNEYIIARSDNGSKEELIRLSTKANTYSSKGESLTCVAHPLQISTDPLVCLIKNKTVWEDKILTTVKTVTAPIATNSQAIADQITSELVEASDDYGSAGGGVRQDDFKAAIAKITDGIIYKLVDDKFKSGTLVSTAGTKFNNYASNGLAGLIQEQFIDNVSDISTTTIYVPDNTGAYGPQGHPYTTLSSLSSLWYLYEIQQSSPTIGMKINLKSSNGSVKDSDLTTVLGGTTPTSYFQNISSLIEYDDGTNTAFIKDYNLSTIELTPQTSTATVAATTLVLSTDDAIATIKNINSLTQEYFLNGDYDKEIGVIGNIYICLDFLYKLAISSQMEAQDSKEKQEINLYSYVKNIASGINAALGSVSNFEVHVDPVDNIGRIIDVNFCEPDKNPKSSTYKNLHTFEIQSLNSVIRNFKLESKIFPNQSAIVAIGAQASGGQLGIQNNTMIDYNSNIKDRVISEKVFPKNAKALEKQKTKPDMASSLANIVLLLSVMNQDNQGNSLLNEATSRAKNSLRDLIVYFQSITTSPSANRNIIPTKLSFEMDGIGGLVIGQLFKIDSSILPRGYKGTGELAQTITGINHSISNGDWKTNIDSLMVILDNIISGFSSLDIKDIVAEAIKLVIAQGITLNKPPVNIPPTPSGPGLTGGGGPGLDPIKYVIGIYESGNDYEEYNFGASGGGGERTSTPGSAYYSPFAIKLTSSTLAQMKGYGRTGAIYAAGRYQIVPVTLDAVQKALGLSDNELYSPAIQEKMGEWLILSNPAPNRVGIGKYLKGLNSGNQKDIEDAIQQLSLEWAALPCIEKNGSIVGNVVTGIGNTTYWGGTGVNRSVSKLNISDVVKALIQSRIQYSGNTPSFIPSYYSSAPSPSPGGGTTTSKAIIMGDSLVPLIKANSSKLQPIGNDAGPYGTGGSVWGSGWTTIALKTAVTAQPVNNSITQVFISQGSNQRYEDLGGANSIKNIVTLIKSKYPSAKLYIFKGDVGSLGVRDGDKDFFNRTIGNGVTDNIQTRISKYYPIWQANGVTVLSNPPIFSTSHPGQNTPGIISAAKEIDNLIP